MLKLSGAFIILFTALSLCAQETYQMPGNKDEIDADFMFAYYSQDGNNGAVTGGIGTEELQDYSSLFIVNVPVDSINAINITLGADYYTSASTDAIDNNVSSASSKDLRYYGNLAYNRKNLKRGETYGLRFGFSSEYDYNSLNGGLSFAKEWNEGNSELSFSAQAFIDQWSLIYPKELRGEISLPTKKRQSYNFQVNYTQVINKRLQMSLSGEVIYMNGILSTPFHRVYFSDQTQVDVERLPSSRIKLPIGFRINYFPIDNFIVRSYYRYYTDDFGIRAHTMSLETPIKVSPSFTISPFYRYHTQTKADYFAPYAEHMSTEAFYTSDYDLSALSSHKYGLGVTYSPLYGIGRMKAPFSKKMMVLDKISLRGMYYDRSTGLSAYLISLNLSFKIK